MKKYPVIISFLLIALLLIGCTAVGQEPLAADQDNSAALPPVDPALPVDDSAGGDEMNEDVQLESPEDSQADPEVQVVAPSGSVNVGELTPEPQRGDGELVVAPAPGVPDPQVVAEQKVRDDLSQQLDIDISEVTVVETEEVEWSDSSLGCPDPDMVYLAVITPGYKITLEAEGVEYVYHTDMNGNFVQCAE